MVNRKNYLYAKEFMGYREGIDLLSPSSLGRYWSYLKHILLWAGENLFSDAYKIRPTFTSYVASLVNPDTGKSLAWTTKKKIIQTGKKFFRWLKDTYPEKFRSITQKWIDTLRPPRQEYQAVEHEYVTLDEVIQLTNFPTVGNTLVMKRDQAAAAMLYLSGMRATAFTTLPISAVDLSTRSIKQWPELGVNTKNGKCATTYLLPIPELLSVVEEWDQLVRAELTPEMRWYAPIKSEWGEQSLSMKEPGLNRTQALGKRLRLLFEATGLQYKSPHKFRHGHAVYGLQHAETMADYKAVSMNLMHSDIKTTDSIYAPLLSDEVGQRIAGLSGGSRSQPDVDLVSAIKSMTDVELLQLLKLAIQR